MHGAVDVLAAKFARYREFFRVQVKDHSLAAPHGGQGVPLWQSYYPPTGRDGYPPVLVVFDPGTRLGEQALKNRMNGVLDLARDHWTGTYKGFGGYSGERADGYYKYGDAIPVLFTTLDRIRRSGPLAAVWWRCGHRSWETLTDALDNPKDVRAWRRRQKERRADDDERRAREAQRTKQWGDAAAGVPVQPEPVLPQLPLCETCGGSLSAGNYDPDDPDLPPPDGRHCDGCRYLHATSHPLTGLFKALFGRQDKQP
ncbi:hypothetical protein [Streptomyces sp. NPDC004324]